MNSLQIPSHLGLTPPSAEEIVSRQELHNRLRVTQDYMRVYLTGLLGSFDLGELLPVDSAKKDAVPFWANDICYWGEAAPVDDEEEMPEVLNSVFYKVASTYGGSTIVQISRGTHRGKLATIPDTAIMSFSFGECSVPSAPLETDEDADSYLDKIQKENVLCLRELTLEQFAQLRLDNTRQP